jgi:uncharacterized protein (TIGR00156 family)
MRVTFVPSVSLLALTVPSLGACNDDVDIEFEEVDDDQGEGGFTGSVDGSGSVSTVAELKNRGEVGEGDGLGGLISDVAEGAALDDQVIVLEGKITAKSADDDGNIYIFEDATGSIEVEINADDFDGQTFGPENTVRITGEADYSENGVGLEVSSLEVIG